MKFAFLVVWHIKKIPEDIMLLCQVYIVNKIHDADQSYSPIQVQSNFIPDWGKVRWRHPTSGNLVEVDRIFIMPNPISDQGNLHRSNKVYRSAKFSRWRDQSSLYSPSQVRGSLGWINGLVEWKVVTPSGHKVYMAFFPFSIGISRNRI